MDSNDSNKTGSRKSGWTVPLRSHLSGLADGEKVLWGDVPGHHNVGPRPRQRARHQRRALVVRLLLHRVALRLNADQSQFTPGTWRFSRQYENTGWAVDVF